MQVIFAALGVKLPAVLSEKARPIVGQTPVRPAVLPVVIVRVGAGFVPAFLKPVVLRGGVVNDQIHDDADAAALCLRDEALHVRHGAVFRVNLTVIADVVAVVRVGGFIDRAEPEGVDA